VTTLSEEEKEKMKEEIASKMREALTEFIKPQTIMTPEVRERIISLTTSVLNQYLTEDANP